MNHNKNRHDKYTRCVSMNEHQKSTQRPKIVKRNYHIMAQTAYHIARLALQENTSEGRIIDKIVRNYQAMAGDYNA